MGAMMIYFTKGIKVQHLEKWTGRYYRFALMMKLVMFEILIVSLQMLPKTQLMLMTIIQFVVIIIIVKGLVVDRIYNHKFFGFMDFITEMTIFCYLLVGNMSTWFGEENLDKTMWTKMQLYEIYLILFTAGMNILQVLYNGILSIYNLIKERKYIVKKQKGVVNYNKLESKSVALDDGEKSSKVRSVRKSKKRAKNLVSKEPESKGINRKLSKVKKSRMRKGSKNEQIDISLKNKSRLKKHAQ